MVKVNTKSAGRARQALSAARNAGKDLLQTSLSGLRQRGKRLRVRWLRPIRPKLRRLVGRLRSTLRSLWLVVVLATATTILSMVPPPVPAYGALNDPTLLATLLAGIAGTLAAIIGIVIAVALVALELLRTTYA